ncbi:MAG: hypothetical protein LBQ94_13295 [Treponema sp.]|jgi:CheY-like chemotaxis protein|nr:hypothetical protein [Treponema sp.]
MYFDDLVEVYHKERRERDMFHDLMRYRVREILLVASLYDSFVLEQDGALSEQIYGEFFNLSLTTIPRVTCAYTPESAKEMFERAKYDMVILMAALDFDAPLELAGFMKTHNPDVPVMLLVMNNSSLAGLDKNRAECKAYIDKIFVWNGYSKLFVGMIKYLEDLRNVESDTQTGLVQVILLVEDSIRYYSRFLPRLFSVVMTQTKLLVEDERSVEKNKVLRMRWRPRILHATNYDEALALLDRYEPFLLTVISDIRYSVNGVEDPEAGFKFCQTVKARKPDLPVLLQSSETSNRERAHAIGAEFADKNSNTLVHELTAFFRTHLGFGPFVFRMPDGRELARVEKMSEFETQIKTIPNESLLYHASRNHFSMWLVARGEVRFARIVRAYGPDDFQTIDALRAFLVESLDKIHDDKTRGSIPLLDSSYENNASSGSSRLKLVRLGGGSIGGKGRGLAFISSLIDNLAFTNLQEKMEIRLPYTAFIGIDEFERFMDRNNMWGFSWFALNDDEIKKLFLSLSMDPSLLERLRLFLSTTDKPLAVRSSGLFEDMLMVTFSGVYDTYVIPNAAPDIEARLSELCDAIRLIYASLYIESSRHYFDAASYKIEEERMAVIIQELAGTRHGRWYYPLVSGTAQSYNYYPVSYLKPDDGLCVAAIGLGCYVVDGRAAFRFSPRYPKLDVVSAGSKIEGSQRNFFALDMERPEFNLLPGSDATLEFLDIAEAEANPDFAMTASTINREDDRLEPGIGNRGPRIVNFAPLLKYDIFPFAEVVDAVLDVGSKSMGLPVEIEFAVTIENKKPVFYFLQLKPLTQNTGRLEEDLSEIVPEDCFVISGRSMGNGRDTSISDIVWVDPESFSKMQTVEIAKEIGELNGLLKARGRHYVLVGPGRWGTRDFSLGIPVKFPQISFARVIVETNLPNFSVESSQGSHFFHNLTSMNIGYLSVSPGREKDRVDWEWLKSLPCEKKLQFCGWSSTNQPLNIVMDGRVANTVIFKQ